MARLTAACLALVCLCSAGFVVASPSRGAPIAVWGSATFLRSATQDEAVPAAQALEELFSAVAGLEGRPQEQALAGLLDGPALEAAGQEGQAPVDAVVVLASGAEAVPAAVQQKMAALAGAAAGSVSLPNAVHEGVSHPVFAGLRASAQRLSVRVLGDCGGAFLPAAAPATAEALREQLAEARSSGSGTGSGPAVLVVCPPSEGEGEAEVALLEAAQLALAELAPRHLIVHALHPVAAPAREQRRRLAAAAAAMVGKSKSGDAANRTKNYTVCDATCHKHVMWFEGIIVLITILIALLVGCCCMHLIDVPTRFAQPEQSRQHQD